MQTKKRAPRKEVQYFPDYSFDIPGCTQADRWGKVVEWQDPLSGNIEKVWIPTEYIQSDGFCNRCGEYHYRTYFGRIQYTGQPMPNIDSGYVDLPGMDDGVIAAKHYGDTIAPINPADQKDDHNLGVIEAAHDFIFQSAGHDLIPKLEHPIPDEVRRQSETTTEYIQSIK